MPNDINSVSPDIRDFLLNRNLILSDTVTENGLSGNAVGLGTRSFVETLPNAVQASENIEVSSENYRNPYSSNEDEGFAQIDNGNVLYGNLPQNTPSVEYGSYIPSNEEDSNFSTISNSTRNSQTLKNRYISNEDMISATIINNNFAYNQTDGGYINENGVLNLGGPSTQPLDAIGSILSGDGFGLNDEGLDPQFDIRNSLAGRVLGATGAINDTPLGIIGGEQLLFALGQKAVFNSQSELHSAVNLDPIGLLKGESLLKADYSISVRENGAGRVLDRALDIAGFNLPTSPIEIDIFEPSETPKYNFNHFLDAGSVDRNNSLLKNTGKGQYSRLFELLNQNTYKPNYTVGNEGVTNFQEYEQVSQDVNLASRNDDGSSYIWGQEEFNEVELANPNSLVGKTKQLFDDNRNLNTWVLKPFVTTRLMKSGYQQLRRIIMRSLSAVVLAEP